MSIFQGFEFDDSHIVDYDELVESTHQWLIVDICDGYCVCVVGARNEQDAYDDACDGCKLDRYQIPESDIDPDIEDDFTRLGNACEPFDLINLRCIKLPAVTMSYCALFDQQHGATFAKHADDE